MSTRKSEPHKLIHLLFQERVQMQPENMAVVCNDQKITYHDLNRRANKLAHYIRYNLKGSKTFLSKNLIVGICVERGINMLIALLATLKIGAAYLPLSPNDPENRLQLLLDEAQAKLVITDNSTDQKFHFTHEQKIKKHCLDDLSNEIAQYSDENLPVSNGADDLAYIIYTSGSTGVPKGVMVEHCNLINLINAQQKLFNITSKSRVIQFSALCFDASVWEIFVTLIYGGTLYIASEEERLDPKKLYTFLLKNKIEIATFPPVFLNQLPKKPLPDLKTLVVAGDVCSEATMRFWSNERILVNAYGPTELTVCAAAHVYQEGDSNRIIGKSFGDNHLYVLDKNLRFCEVGKIGELYVSGPGVSRGYLNSQEKTAEKFIKNNFDHKNKSRQKFTRLYRTGDLVRWIDKANLEFIGRADNQVKIRGHRVELGEIEKYLYAYPKISECAVIALSGDRPASEGGFEKYLSAYIVCDGKILLNKLRTFLSNSLPQYMLPSRFISLDALPLTISGKVDKKKLIQINASENNLLSEEKTHKAPRNNIEEALIDIWSDTLAIDKNNISIDDDFIELGGHSLSAIELSNKINKHFCVNLFIKDIFQYPTVADLSRIISKETKHYKPPELKANISALYEPFDLTEIQQAYLFGRSADFSLGNISTHGYSELDFDCLDINRLEKAVNILIERHEMLRVIFLREGKQKFLRETPFYKISVTDLSGCKEKDVDYKLKCIRDEFSHKVFDPFQWPLFDFRITKLKDKYRFHISVDCLVFDGLSYSIFFSELGQLYQNLETRLPKLTLNFRDYLIGVHQLKAGPLYDIDKNYWLNRIETLPFAPELFLQKKPIEIKQPHFLRVTKEISKEAWSNFKNHARKNKLSATSALLTAFSNVLNYWSKTPNFLINVTLFNRMSLHDCVNSIVGDFSSLNLLELKMHEMAGQTFSDQSALVQKQLFDDLSHPLFGGIDVQREMVKMHGPNVLGSIGPVVFTSMLDNDIGNNWLFDADGYIGTEYSITQTSQVWLDYKAYEKDDCLIIEWDYLCELFPEDMIENMHDAYCNFIDYFSLHPWDSVGFNLLPQSTYELINRANGTEEAFELSCLHERFITLAQDHSDNQAIITSSKHLSYKDLLDKVAYVSDTLKKLNTKRNRLVAVLMDKSEWQVIACLAILQHGSAYLPLNVQWPEERILEVLKQGEVDVIVTTREACSRFGDSDILSKFQIVQADIGSGKNIKIPPNKTSLDDIAYVIFTSGSTGKPKGVVISHSNAFNTILDMNKRFHVTSEDSVLALSDLSFDLSVYDIFGMLSVGATLVLPDADKIKDPEHWIQLLIDKQVSIWNSVPMFMQMLVEYISYLPVKQQTKLINKLKNTLRLILLSGDWIPLDLPQKIWEIFPTAQIISLGGATEGSIWSIIYPIKRVEPDWSSIPYGKALTNQKMYVLDEGLQYCPERVIGEIYIGGAGVALGYWKDEEKSQRSFIEHASLGRIYKTGDLGRLLPDGNIEFIGREDNQVKIGGHRIELGEIEGALNNLAEIKHAVVDVATQNNREKKLVAYIVPAHHDNGIFKSLEEKINFKQARYNIEAYDSSLTKYELPNTRQVREDFDDYFQRKSYRCFTKDQLTVPELIECFSPAENSHTKKMAYKNNCLLDKLGLLLSDFYAYREEGLLLPKYRYPSAGSLYPVQIYLVIGASAAMDGEIKSGVYYYHPHEHSMIRIADRDFKNNNAVELHLVSKLDAITPIYGGQSKMFCELEAGYMLNLFERKVDHSGLDIVSIDRNINELLGQSEGYQYHFGFRLADREKISPSNICSAYQDSWSIYVYIKADRVRNIPEGLYQYYHGELAFIQQKQVGLQSFNQTGINGALLAEASCVVFFVGQDSVGSYQFVGKYAQSILDRAIRLNIGSCAIGGFIGKLGFEECFSGKILHAIALGKVDEEQILSHQYSEANTGLYKEIVFSEKVKFLLTKKLPSYMIPHSFVELDHLPLNATGKVDRQALLLHDVPDKRVAQYVVPTTEEEKMLVSIWQELLNIELVGVHDDFFKIGGNSLIATQVISRLRSIFNVEIPIKMLFDYPTIQQLAYEIKTKIIYLKDFSKTKFIESIKTQKINKSLPIELSFAQQRLWFLYQYEGKASPVYNIPVAFKLYGSIDVTALRNAIGRLIKRHDSLRTIFKPIDGVPYQIILEDIDCPLIVKNIESGQEETILYKEGHQGFNLEKPPLVRFCLLQSSDGSNILSIVQHHIISDGWSMSILINELNALYNSCLEKENKMLVPLLVQYAGFSVWQRSWLRGEILKKHLHYWKENLNHYSVLQLPTDFSRPRMQEYVGSHIGFEITLDVQQKLNSLAMRNNVTLFAVLLSAFNILLHKYTGQNDIIVGTPIANRTHNLLEPIIGFFANTLVMRNTISSSDTIESVLKTTMSKAVDAYEHQDIPFERLVDELKIERSVSYSPLFQVMFVLQNLRERPMIEFSDVQAKRLDLNHDISKFDLTLELIDQTNGLIGSFEYNTGLFKQATIEKMVAHFKHLLSEIAYQEKNYVYQLQLLTEDEKNNILCNCVNQKISYSETDKIFNKFNYQSNNIDAAKLNCFVLDSSLEPVPLGMQGELYISAPNFIEFLLKNNKADKKEIIKKYFYDIDHLKQTVSLYKTGHLVQWLSGKGLKYLGKVDDLCQVNGFKINIETIKEKLLQIDQIKRCEVLVKKVENKDQLIAYYTLFKPNANKVSEVFLSDHLREQLADYAIPNEFVYLEEFPITPDGLIDLEMLLSINVKNDLVNVGNPRDRYEWGLMRIWQQLLESASLSITDDFFDVGGTSLLVIKLANQIDKEFSVKLSIASFFQHRTIESCARIIRKNSNFNDKKTPLILLKPSEHKKTFVCIHPAGGTVFCYLRLAELMQSNYEVYGIQSVGIDDQQQPLRTIDAMTKSYIKFLEPIIKNQTIVIAGWSFGGYVAYEVGYQLAEKGVDASVILFDSSPPLEGQKAESDEVAKAIFIEKMLKFNGFPPGTTEQQINRLYKVYNCNRCALNTFKLKMSKAKLLYINTLDNKEYHETFTNRWQAYHQKDIASEIIDATHWNIMDKPQVNEVSNIIHSYEDYLNE